MQGKFSKILIVYICGCQCLNAKKQKTREEEEICELEAENKELQASIKELGQELARERRKNRVSSWMVYGAPFIPFPIKALAIAGCAVFCIYRYRSKIQGCIVDKDIALSTNNDHQP